MITRDHRINLNESPNSGSAQAAIFSLRQGLSVPFQMYSDEFMREYLNDEDYAFWLEMKSASKISD